LQAADSAAGCSSIYDVRLQAALLCNPAIGQDQQIVAQLLQTSQEMHAAVAELCATRLPVVLHTKLPQRAQACAQWLSKHAGLLQKLALQLNFQRADMTAHSGAAMATVEPALQQALAADSMQLQSMSIMGSSISHSTIERISPARLTSLHAEVNCHCPSTMQALAALTGLRNLRLTNTAPIPTQPPGGIGPMWDPPVAAEDNALAPLAAGLQQLTQLRIGQLRPVQLRWLPPRLQQLHLAVGLWRLGEMAELAALVEQQASIVSTLELVLHRSIAREALDVIKGLANAFGAATAKGATASSATATAAAGLQSFSILGCYPSAAPLLGQFPAGTLTCLVCPIDWRSSSDIDALCSLTALQSLRVLPNGPVGEHYVSCPGGSAVTDTALSRLMALQRLTSLELSATRRAQLYYLRLPQLLQLSVIISRNSQEGAKLNLSLLTSLQRLTLLDQRTPLQESDRLPRSLRCLQWPGRVEGVGCSVKPLLALQHLEELQLRVGAANEELSGLAALRSLADMQLAVDGTKNLAEAAACWHLLPLTALEIASPVIPAVVLQRLWCLRGLKRLTLSKVTGCGLSLVRHCSSWLLGCSV
jgi:hypothetical protein